MVLEHEKIKRIFSERAVEPGPLPLGSPAVRIRAASAPNDAYLLFIGDSPSFGPTRGEW
jgi:hypothetical protein